MVPCPFSVTDQIYKPVDGLALVPETTEKTSLATQVGVYTHGFAIVDLAGGNANVAYYQDLNDQSCQITYETIA
jgi:hypothetical protein